MLSRVQHGSCRLLLSLLLWMMLHLLLDHGRCSRLARLHQTRAICEKQGTNVTSTQNDERVSSDALRVIASSFSTAALLLTAPSLHIFLASTGVVVSGAGVRQKGVRARSEERPRGGPPADCSGAAISCGIAAICCCLHVPLSVAPVCACVASCCCALIADAEAPEQRFAIARGVGRCGEGCAVCVSICTKLRCTEQCISITNRYSSAKADGGCSARSWPQQSRAEQERLPHPADSLGQSGGCAEHDLRVAPHCALHTVLCSTASATMRPTVPAARDLSAPRKKTSETAE